MEDIEKLREETAELLRILQDIPRRNREMLENFRAGMAESRRISEEGVRMQREAARRARWR